MSAIVDLVLTFFSGLRIEQNLGTSEAALNRKIKGLIRTLREL